MEGCPVFQRFDLSQRKSLRTLEITAMSIPPVEGWFSGESDLPRVSDLLKTVISSVAPSVSLDLAVVYRDVLCDDGPCVWGHRCHCHNRMSELFMDEDDFEQATGSVSRDVQYATLSLGAWCGQSRLHTGQGSAADGEDREGGEDEGGIRLPPLRAVDGL